MTDLEGLIDVLVTCGYVEVDYQQEYGWPEGTFYRQPIVVNGVEGILVRRGPTRAWQFRASNGQFLN